MAAADVDEYGHAPSTIGAGRRVLHVTTRHRRGGAERNIAHFIAWELANGYEVDVLVGRDSDAGGLPRGARVRRVSTLVREVDPLHDARAWRTLRSIVADGGYHLVHTHLSKAGILGRVAGRGRATRIVHTVHMASFGPGYGATASWIFRAAERHCAGFTDAMVYVGDGLRERYLANGVGRADTSRVIHSPIEVDRFLESRAWGVEARQAIREELSIDVDVPLVVAIGSLEPRKRHHLLVEALRPMLAAGDVSLAIAGDGPERADLERTAARLGVAGRVHLLGHLADPVPLVAAADVLALTSTVEGVPQVVLQALAAGRPVVATDVPGLREIPEAPITTVPAEGAGIREAVVTRLAEPGPTVEPAAFAPWTCPEIDEKIRALHEQVLGQS
jgi:glycosyltransferase involved in cell wall biosynthesis